MTTLNDIKTEYIGRCDGDAIVVNALLALLDECQPCVKSCTYLPGALGPPLNKKKKNRALLAILNSDKPLEVE